MSTTAVYLRRPQYLLFLLIAVLIFQVSVIPDSLGIKPLGRLVNILTLLSFLMMMMSAMTQNNPVTVFFYYITPILFILIGFAINLSRSLNIEALGWFSILLPWIAALSVPFHEKLSVSKSWEIFYRFLLISTVITLFEYIAVFSGMIVPAVIETDRGVFLKGIISIFHGLDNDEVHYRYYSVFAEPGTAAMFLLIGLTYALVFSKKIGATIFLSAICLTDSLGGFFSLLIICVLFMTWKCNEMRCSLATRFFIIMIFIFGSLSSIGFFYERYEQKQNSAVVREDNVKQFSENLMRSLAENPFGFELKGKTLSELEGDHNYYGSNLAFYVAFVQGGIIAFLGYSWFIIMIVIITIKYFILKPYDNKLLACVFISIPALLLFLFQRATIFESVIFSFLYASPVIKLMLIKLPVCIPYQDRELLSPVLKL